MSYNHLDPSSAAGLRSKQIDDAREMQRVIAERANRTGDNIPPYEFLELIGKGAFGRVYKCRSKETRNIVAVKIIDVDEEDYRQDHKLKDEAIEGFIKEVNTLKQVRDSQAKNINHIQEAFDLHSQLWIVSDYCSGGSVHTLMKATPPKPHLEEKFIIPIARELAIALRHVHDAGVIHRDIKCGNVLISEDGRLQLCDFGVAAIIETDVSKRSTIIGTPYWMAPEMHSDAESGYGTEIDCWAFGCTVFEMATGMPPYHTFAPAYLPQVLKSVPRLQGGEYSQELCEFVAFCLQAVPDHRPTAKQILAHPYLHDTSDRYPTDSLKELIDRYIQWERKGGQRMSLFNAAGAAAPQMPGEQEMSDSWIFSTTDQFEKDYERRHSHAPSITAMDFRGGGADSGGTSPAMDSAPPSATLNKRMTPYEKAEEESRAKRGERYMQRLFKLDDEPYDYDTTVLETSPRRLSDLPLRNLVNDRTANRETLIDLDTGALDMSGPPSFNFEIGDVPTMKANRQSTVDNEDDEDGYQTYTQHTRKPTRDWKFPSLDLSPEDDADSDANAKRATKDWKFPMSRSEDALVPDSGNSTNRRTMDWTFNTAEHIEEPEPEPDFAFPSLQSGRPTVPGFRPSLQRTATEPGGQYNDHLHPPRQKSLEVDKSVVRESTAMIDLDLGGGAKQPNFELGPAAETTRSTTPLSIANSFTSIGPFDLEQDPVKREEDLRRYSHRRQQKSSVSHIVAQQRISRSLHERRQPSYGSGGPNGHGGGSGSGGSISFAGSRVRGNSVDSTASSTADERSWEHGSEYNHYVGSKMRDQLRIGLQRTASQPGQPAQPPNFDSFDDNESEPYTAGPYRAGGGETDSSFRDVSNIPRATRPPSVFPSVTAPDQTALAEGARKETMYAEIDKLFGVAEEALGYAVDIFRRRELDFAEDTVTGSESDNKVFAATSEEEESTSEAC